MKLAHVMLRVSNLEKSIDFYTNALGMRLIRQNDNKEYKYTLAFLGYANDSCLLELTYNWGVEQYNHGDAFGHLCLEVEDVYKSCEDFAKNGVTVTRPAGPVKGGSTIIAFIEDPDGYKIELISNQK